VEELGQDFAYRYFRCAIIQARQYFSRTKPTLPPKRNRSDSLPSPRNGNNLNNSGNHSDLSRSGGGNKKYTIAIPSPLATSHKSLSSRVAYLELFSECVRQMKCAADILFFELPNINDASYALYCRQTYSLLRDMHDNSHYSDTSSNFSLKIGFNNNNVGFSNGVGHKTGMGELGSSQRFTSDIKVDIVSMVRNGTLQERGLYTESEVVQLIKLTRADKLPNDRKHGLNAILSLLSAEKKPPLAMKRSRIREEICKHKDLLLLLIDLCTENEMGYDAIVKQNSNDEIAGENGDEDEKEKEKVLNKVQVWRGIHPEDVVKTKKLGYGASAAVFKGTFFGKDVAIKIFNVDETDKLGWDYLRREITILSLFSHPNLLSAKVLNK